MRRTYYGTQAHVSFGPGLMTPAVKALIWTNVGVFVSGMLIPPLGRFLIGFFGLRPQLVVEGLRIWQPFTYLFLHGGFGHLLFNMLVLWMFGVQLERLWGARFFLRYYFVAGVGAGFVTIGASFLPFVFADPTYVAVTIGASGAIYGLLMAFALYYPETPILMFFLFPVPAKYFVMIIGAITFLSVPRGGGIAHIAHLGGLVIGYVYLKRLQGLSASRLRFGQLGVMADIKYRYLKWKMGRLRKRFNVYSGGSDRNWQDWDKHLH